MRTLKEIAFEAQRLRKLKPAVGTHRRNVETAITEAVDELCFGVDMTCEEFDDQPDIVKDCVKTARRWKEGSSNERPSDGFGKLVVP